MPSNGLIFRWASLVNTRYYLPVIHAYKLVIYHNKWVKNQTRTALCPSRSVRPLCFSVQTLGRSDLLVAHIAAILSPHIGIINYEFYSRM